MTPKQGYIIIASNQSRQVNNGSAKLQFASITDNGGQRTIVDNHVNALEFSAAIKALSFTVVVFERVW